MTETVPVLKSTINMAEESKSKRKQIRRMKQRMRRRERHRNQVDFAFCGDPSLIVPSSSEQCFLDSKHSNIPLAEVWERVQSLTRQWLELYSFQGIRHSRLRELLLSEKLVTFLKDNGVLTSSVDSLPNWLQLKQGSVKNAEVSGCLLAILDQLESGLSSLHVPTTNACESAPDTIRCELPDTSVVFQLKFKNTGLNSVIDIGTYLQEKLDVLEFLQSDSCQSTKLSSRLSLNSSVEISRPPSAMSNEESGGFFIGTPRARKQWEESVRWETGSASSRISRSSMRRHGSSNRLRSSSVSSVASAKTRLKSGRGRRFFAKVDQENSLTNDEE